MMEWWSSIFIGFEEKNGRISLKGKLTKGQKKPTCIWVNFMLIEADKSQQWSGLQLQMVQNLLHKFRNRRQGGQNAFIGPYFRLRKTFLW